LTVTSRLGEFLSRLEYEELPQQVIEAAKSCILDTLGCILSGGSFDPVPKLVDEFCSDNCEKKEATVLGYGRKTSILLAALLNGTMGHAAEMDDVHQEAKAHAGTVVIPAAFSIGEKNGATGKDIILAVTAGYEAMIRIGIGINAAAHRLKGWHATGTCGTFGAAAAAAKLYRFNAEQFTSALGLSGTQSAGLWAFTADGADCKMFHAGNACMSGIIAQRLAAAGMRGPSQIIEAADGGLYKASSDDYNFAKVTEALGERFVITEVARKPFACCRSMHPPIEAVLRLRKNIPVEKIDKIRVLTYEVARVQCGFINRLGKVVPWSWDNL